ncbi:halocarboxylic acid dehydrogenase DehI family protein [Bacillus sp. AK128]
MVRYRYGVPEIMESGATGNLKVLYEDIKYVLKVPIVNFIFRTLAYYDHFLQIGWSQVRGNMVTSNMEEAAASLRYPETSFQPPAVDWGIFYTLGTIGKIRGTIFTFNYVNTKLLLIATAWEEALSHRPILGGKANKGFLQPGVLPGLPSINLVNIPEASKDVQQLLIDIIKTKKGYDAASDYRALAQYPRFLEVAWPSMKPHIGSDEYILNSHSIREKARTLVHQQMPYPVTLTPEYLYSFYSPKDVAGIMGVVAMFSSFLSDLIIDGEYLRKCISV